MDDRLEEILQMAAKDPVLYERLMATKKEPYPVREFCRLCTELGYELSVGELIALGEDFCDAMLRSVNGGGVNPPNGGWNDMYDMFFTALEQLHQN